jgi:hypothetical protein
LMSVTSPFARRIFKAGLVVAVWLTSVSATLAMPRELATPKYCDPQTTSSPIRKLVSNARAVGTPLVKRLRQAGIRIRRNTSAIRLTARAHMRDEDQAIQNDAPAPPLAVEPRIDLRPLGVFADAAPAPLDSRALSPRSPRGPPAGASHGFRFVTVSSNRGDRCEWCSLT